MKIETCKECEGRGEVETGIGMFPCDTCHGSGDDYSPGIKDLEKSNKDLLDALQKFVKGMEGHIDDESQHLFNAAYAALDKAKGAC